MSEEKKGPGFGSAFAPHMLVQHYKDASGWAKAEFQPFGPFTLSPATVVFHYGQEIFEGFKAYRQPDGSISLFRPDRNLARLNASAARLCMPQVDAKILLADICRLIKLDASCVPQRPYTLYIRPCMIGTDTVIKVHPSPACLLFVITCVVGEYFAGEDPRGVRLRTETVFVRAAAGGTGAAKCGGNYASSLAAQSQAAAEGFDQVVWLDAIERKYIEEMGGMNIMFLIGEALVTPALDSGSILPGVTRESLLQLVRSQGRKVEEREISVDELLAENQAGRLKEVFACGTAAVVTPIRELVHKNQVLYRNAGDKPGELTVSLRQQLMDIQFGSVPDPFGWRYPVPL